MLRPDHTIFQQPFAVSPRLETTPSPDNFKKWQPGFPDTVQTFAIFTPLEGKMEPGLVTGNFGFEDVPDAERIVGGINMKGPQYAAIARHGSFVMWGFHSSPEQLTDAGRRLYLNTLAYAHAKKGEVVEALRLRPTRADHAAAFDVFLGLYPEAQRSGMLARHHGGEAIPPELLTDAELRARWLAERRPFLHPIDDGSNWETQSQLTVDAQCRELGVANDSLAFLDAIAARLCAAADDALAADLLARYVPGVAPTSFADWLGRNRDRLYFTESGGWIWRERGTPAQSPALCRVDGEADELVTIDAATTGTTLTVTMRIRKGWHAWTPVAKGQNPVTIAILPGSVFEAAGDPVFDATDDGMLTGYAAIKVPLRRVGEGVAIRIAVSYTLCDEQSCRPARTVELGN